MPRVAALVAELEREAATTRRLLERLPDARLGWTPHPKSRSLGALAMHVATTPGDVLTMAMQNPAMPANAPDVSPATTAEVLAAFDASITNAASLLRNLSDAQLDVPLPSIYGPSADENPFA